MRISRIFFALTGLFVWALAASDFGLSSPDFTPGSTIPKQYTCAGSQQSPPLSFANPPATTKSFALVGWDENAPGGLASQWILYDLPPSTAGLPANIAAGAVRANFKQGKNSYGQSGYTAPCAQDGKVHPIYFDLYALDVSSLGLPAGASLEAVQAQIKRHRIQEAKLMGLAR